MIRFSSSMRRLTLRTLPAALALAATVAALADPVGGTEVSALGTGPIAVRTAGLRPVRTTLNMEFDFDGPAEATSGTGTARGYNPNGTTLLEQIPFIWTSRRRTTIDLALDRDALGAYLGDLVGDALDRPVVIDPVTATCKGNLRKEGTKLAVTLVVKGFAEIDGGGARMQGKIRLK